MHRPDEVVHAEAYRSGFQNSEDILLLLLLLLLLINQPDNNSAVPYRKSNFPPVLTRLGQIGATNNYLQKTVCLIRDNKSVVSKYCVD